MKIFFFVIAFTAAFSVNAQDLKESGVPEAVKTNFASLYPDIQQVNWEKENGKFEAEFKLNNVKTSVLFDANGTLIQTETEIAVSSLPVGVSDYVSKNLSGNAIDEATKIVNVTGKVTYEAEVGKEDYVFDESGNLLNKEMEKLDDNDNENDNNNDNDNDND